MKITILTENTAINDNIKSEHGLSLFIETKDKRILFDSGNTEIFAENAEVLGIDLSTADIAVLSHDHDDHSGGLLKFIEINKKAPIYINQNALDPHYNYEHEYIGSDMSIFDSGRVKLTDDEYPISSSLTLFTCNDKKLKHPIDPSGLMMLCEGRYVDEDFRHEQYLLIEEKGKRILISGCSHKGILNIMHWLSPDILIGGFHFMNISTDTEEGISRLTSAANELLSYNCRYYTGHCTGIEQFKFMKNIMGDRLSYISSGMTLNI